MKSSASVRVGRSGPLHVAHVIDHLGTGGTQQGLVTFSSLAASRSVLVTVISLAADAETMVAGRLRAAGAQIEPMPGRGLRDLARLVTLVRHLRRRRFDIVHTHLQYANILGVLAARLAGIPVVAGLHLADVDSFGRRPFTEAMERLALTHGADAVAAVGHETALAHEPRLGRAITVLPNATLPVAPLPAADRLRVRTELSGDVSRPLVVSVGRLRPVKGFTDLLLAFDAVRRIHTNALLVIVGSGPLESELRARRDALGLAPHVSLLGERSDVSRLLAAADLYVSASRMEGLPQTLLEAMAAGLPVVATAVGDVPALVTPDTGLVVPSGDAHQLAKAICCLLGDPQGRARLGAGARDRLSSHHDAHAWVDKTLEMYRGCLAGGCR